MSPKCGCSGRYSSNGVSIYENYKSAFVTINSEKKPGSTSFVSCSGCHLGNGFILTSTHCLREPIDKATPSDIIPRHYRFFVAMYNIGKDKKSYSYEAVIVGMDGLSDVAVLYIDPDMKWNRTNPSVNDHISLSIGCSDHTPIGTTVYTFGNPASVDALSFRKGYISDNNYSERSARDLVSFQLDTLPGNSGGAIIRGDGKIISMNSWFIQRGVEIVTFGPSSRLISKITSAFIESWNNKYLSDKFHPKTKLFEHPFGNFYLYVKGYLGTFLLAPISNLQMRSREDGCGLKLYPSEEGPAFKEMTGYVVVYIDGMNTCPFIPPSGTKSPVLNILRVNDLITSINGIKVGQDDSSVMRIMWNSKPGDKVMIKFRRQSDNYAEEREIAAFLGDYPPLFEYNLPVELPLSNNIDIIGNYNITTF